MGLGNELVMVLYGMQLLVYDLMTWKSNMLVFCVDMITPYSHPNPGAGIAILC